MHALEERLMRAVVHNNPDTLRDSLIAVTATMLNKNQQDIIIRMESEWDEKREECETFLGTLAQTREAWLMYYMPGTSGLGRLNIHAMREDDTLLLEWEPTDNTPKAIKTRFAELFSSRLEIALPRTSNEQPAQPQTLLAKVKTWFKR